MIGAIPPQVILLAGPSGAGKSSTAARIARHPPWEHLSEDDYWVRIKEGRPPGELRTPAEQRIVQDQVIELVTSSVAAGGKVVLEFILYEAPPLPLLRYQAALRARRIPFATRLLRPELEEVLRRIRARGRPRDADLDQRRVEAIHQLGCLDGPHVDPLWRLDTTGMSLEAVYQQHFRPLVEIGDQGGG